MEMISGISEMRIHTGVREVDWTSILVRVSPGTKYETVQRVPEHVQVQRPGSMMFLHQCLGSLPNVRGIEVCKVVDDYRFLS